jgi:hypothetical protein
MHPGGGQPRRSVSTLSVVCVSLIRGNIFATKKSVDFQSSTIRRLGHAQQGFLVLTSSLIFVFGVVRFASVG